MLTLVHAGMHVAVERLPGESEEAARARLWRKARLLLSVEFVGHPQWVSDSAAQVVQ